MSIHKQIEQLLLRNAGAQRLSNVFDDFTEISALTLRNAVDPIGHAERYRRYLDIVARYDRAQLDRFAEALAMVTMLIRAEPHDVLGRLYMELDLGNERLGQFFTPYDVARLLAALSIDPLVTGIREHGVATLYEPACGAAAFIIATTQELRAAGMDYQRQLHVTAEDVSAQAVHMAYVQLTLLDVPAVVHHSDTLTQVTYDSWPTPAHVLHGWGSRFASPETSPNT